MAPGARATAVDTALAWAGRLDEGSENDSSVMSELYRPLMIAAAADLDVHVMVHTTKSVPNLRRDGDFNLGHIRGSGAVVASSGLVWGIEIPAATGRRTDQRYLAVLRDKLTGRTDAMYTRLTFDCGIERLGYADLLDGSDDAEIVDVTERVLEAIDLLIGAHELATASAIRSTASIKRDDVFATLGKLEDAGSWSTSASVRATSERPESSPETSPGTIPERPQDVLLRTGTMGRFTLATET